ncbi:hypothetical protein BJ944DRAFT_261198 [Cunninghamella echinulata]|nr:hypothetical protein BJ944DRAFT_261198 [Cunninghamella echinulata]
MTMITFPNEILENIFIYLPHKYLSNVSLVCKEWYSVTRLPSFYYTISLKNSAQFEKFIDMATNTYILQQPIGHIVRFISLEHYFKEYRLTMIGIKRLNDACPHLQSIDYLDIPFIIDEAISFSAIRYWPDLTILPSWLTQHEENWYLRIWQNDQDYMNNDKMKKAKIIRQLEFTINNNLIQLDKNDNKNKFIKLQLDIKQRKRKLRQSPIIIDDDYYQPFFQEVQENEGYYSHYGMIMSFPLSSYTWSHLDQLTLHFDQYIINTIDRLPSIFQSDERTLDAIHESCPILSSLTLKSFFFNISDSFLNTNNNQPFHPTHTLKKLILEDCSLQQPECFDYILKKYPGLTYLTLNLRWGEDEKFMVDREEATHFMMSIADLITGLNQLSSLSVHMSALDAYDYLKWKQAKKSNKEEGEEEKDITYSGYWPQSAIINWLKDRPSQLKVLDYPFDLYTLDTKNHIDDNDSGQQQQQYAYLDYLSELILLNESHLLKTYHYLIDHGKRNHISYTLTSLTIQCVVSHHKELDSYTFHFHNWLNKLPSLKKLKLEEVDVDTADQQEKQIQHKQHCYKSLKELDLKSCKIMSKNGLTTICQSSPSLNILKLYNITIYNNNIGTKTSVNDNEKNKDDKESNYGDDDHTIVIDAPHLVLDELYIRAIFNDGDWTDEVAPFDLTIHESSKKDSKTHIIKYGDDMYPTTKMVIYCRSFDIFCCLNFL